MKHVVISGPSGAGKGTLIAKLIKKHPNTFVSTISHTTRSPRPGEVRGKHYHFVSKSWFLENIKKLFFVEFVRSLSGNYYGTSLDAINEAIKTATAQEMIVFTEVDVDGAQVLKKMEAFSAAYFFISPPSLEVLETRLRERGTETEDDIPKRLERAKEELQWAETSGIYDGIIVNDKLDLALESLCKQIFGAD